MGRGLLRARDSAIGAYLHQQDDRRHLISVHSLRAISESVQRASWYTYHTVQDNLDNYNPTRYTWFVHLYRRVPEPILAHECLWEGNFYQREAGLATDNLRGAAWVIALCGGQINYADEVVPPRGWQRRQDIGKTFSEPGTAMQPQGRFYTQLKVLGDLWCLCLSGKCRRILRWRIPESASQTRGGKRWLMRHRVGE